MLAKIKLSPLPPSISTRVSLDPWLTSPALLRSSSSHTPYSKDTSGNLSTTSSPTRVVSLFVLCCCDCEGLPTSFYSLDRLVPVRIKYGNTRNRRWDGGGDLPAKARAIWRQKGVRRPRGSFDPQVPPLTPPFVQDTARWAPILCTSVLGLCTSVFSIKWAHLVSVTQDEVFCVFLLCLVLVFSLFRVWVPANQKSPKLMELIRIKPYNYFWWFQS